MDPHEIQGSELVERYLRGRLTPAEEQAFEEAYLADPRLLEEVQLAERLREGLQDHEADAAPRVEPRRGWLAVAASPRYGIAASFVAALALVAAGALYVENQQLPSAGFSAARQTRVLPLVAVRGAANANANTIAAPAPDEWTVLMLDTGFADYDVFSAALLRADTGEVLVRLDGMTAIDGSVAFGMPGSALPPGRYEVRLEGGRRDWPAGRALDELSRTPLTVTPNP